MGGVPYWGVTDLGRNRAINAQVGDLFWDGVFMDDQGLETSPSTEGHWFLAEDEAVVTVVNDASVPVRFSGYPGSASRRQAEPAPRRPAPSPRSRMWRP